MAIRRPFDQKLVLSKPSATLLNAIFLNTVNAASRTLVTVVNSFGREGERWSASEHARYVFMLMVWFAVWVIRVVMDYFPSSVFPSLPSPAILDAFLSGSSISQSSSMALTLPEGFNGRFDRCSSEKAIGRALSQVVTLVNELPVTSRKYQFAVAMAEKIVDENDREGHLALQEINRAVLSEGFARTLRLLHTSMQSSQMQKGVPGVGMWPIKVLYSLPIASQFLSLCRNLAGFWVGTMIPWNDAGESRSLVMSDYCGYGGGTESVVTEKLAQELLWITTKLKYCSAVEEAVVQWSFASGLATLALTANVRIQGLIVKITAILFRELSVGDFESSKQLKFRFLLTWLPLFCYASNGITHPVLNGFEKMEIERLLEDMILSLPSLDQEILLSNWLYDFTVSSSDWPNLQRAFERWCRSSRNLLL